MSSESYNQKLLNACRYGNIKEVNAFISKGADINYSDMNDPFQCTCLTEASRCNKENIVKLLLLKGVNVNQTISHNITSLHLACERGHINVVRILLKENNINIKCKELFNLDTPLHILCESNNYDIIPLLVEHKNNRENIIKIKNRTGDTPLHLSCVNDRYESTKAILKYYNYFDNNDTLNDDTNDLNNILSDNDYKEDTKYDEKTDYDDIESLGGLDSLSGLDNDDDGLCCAHDCNDDILNKMREREEIIRNKLNNQSDNESNESNDTQNDEDLTHDSNITNNIKITTDEDITIYKPLKRLAKIKLQDWGLIKYEINFVKNGYIKLGQFSELTQEILVNQLGIPNNDSILFIQKYHHFMGAI
mmetsp:Transcript_24476/g.29882  ORF Transcript_24476/g.29882 Transcript_24476/m.29882 type:complete len:363 (+) Transcript_24476:31-1119(+)